MPRYKYVSPFSLDVGRVQERTKRRKRGANQSVKRGSIAEAMWEREYHEPD